MRRDDFIVGRLRREEERAERRGVLSYLSHDERKSYTSHVDGD
jgi:hypothetical protein